MGGGWVARGYTGGFPEIAFDCSALDLCPIQCRVGLPFKTHAHWALTTGLVPVMEWEGPRPPTLDLIKCNDLMTTRGENNVIPILPRWWG